jgi:hypothetical protein
VRRDTKEPKVQAAFFNLNLENCPLLLLGQCVLFGAPWLFNGIWKMVAPLLNEVTASKILFLEGTVDKPEKWTPVLEEHWPTDLVQWTVREMKENRGKTSPPKEYWNTKHPNGSPKEHDSRAVKSYVNSPWFISPIKGLDGWTPPDLETVKYCQISVQSPSQMDLPSKKEVSTSAAGQRCNDVPDVDTPETSV